MIIGIVAAAVLVVAGTVIFLIYLFGQMQATSNNTGDVQNAQAEIGTISSTVEGTGNLAASDSSAVKIPKGLVIEDVKVQNGQVVKVGDPIATVTKASAANELLTVRENIDTVESEIDNLSGDVSDTSSTEYLRKLVLEAELSELEANQRILDDILTSQTIVAPYAGTIADLNLTVGSTVEASSQNASNNSSNSNSNQSSSQQNSQNTMRMMSYDSNEQNATVFTTLTGDAAQTFEALEAQESENDTTILEDAPVLITQSNELQITAPRTGAIPQSQIAVREGSIANYTGTITWDNANPTFNAGVSYAATIVLTANEGYSFSKDILVEIDNTLLINWQVFGEDSGNRLRIVAVFEQTSASDSGDKDPSEQTPSTPSGGSSSGGGGSSVSGGGTSQSTPSGGDSSTSNSNASSELTTSDSLLTTIATIGSNTKAKVNINVDELDILTIQTGQKADVTLDALENQTFGGTVVSISSEASGSDSIKYAVTVELDKTDSMLIGMSAAATIKIKEASDVLMIPINALQETGDTVFVYTSADASGNLSGAVEIKIGLSDGQYVEVTEGLSENATVYYLRTSTESNNNQFPGGGMIIGGGSIPGGMGGSRPQGAQMIPIG